MEANTKEEEPSSTNKAKAQVPKLAIDKIAATEERERSSDPSS